MVRMPLALPLIERNERLAALPKNPPAYADAKRKGRVAHNGDTLIAVERPVRQEDASDGCCHP
jgi:hypothetical protein